jgi:hypothetical protein
MIGDNGKKDETELDETDDILDEDVFPDTMPDIGGDTVIDVSGELKALVEKLDKEDPDDAAHKREVHRRLEELREKRDEDLDSTFNFNLDDDV